MMVSSSLGHYTKVFGANIALSLAGKTGAAESSGFSPFPFFPFC
jgi:hypothetical protein